MPRMVAFFGLGCSIALAGATCEQENALSMVQMMAQRQLFKAPADDGSETSPTVEPAPAEAEWAETIEAAEAAEEAIEEATGEDAVITIEGEDEEEPWQVVSEDQALQQRRTDADLADNMSLETNASVISSASHWGAAGTCKVTDDTFFSVFDGAKVNASLLQADIDTDTTWGTNTDAGFRLKDVLQDGEAKDLWLVRGRAHDGSTVRIAARYWRNKTSTGHQVFLKSLAVSGGFITNRTLVVRPLQDNITWNNKKKTYAILKSEDSWFNIAGLINATRKASTSGSTVEVTLPKEVKLLITRHQKFISLAISMPPLAIQDGLCGNFNGDSSDDTLGMILSRGPRVKDEHALLPAEWVPRKAAREMLTEDAKMDGEMLTENLNEWIGDVNDPTAP